MKFPTATIILWTVGFSLVVICNLYFYQILTEVNAQRSQSEQIEILGANTRLFTILSFHSTLYPDSHKRKYMFLLFATGMILVLIGLAIGVAANLPIVSLKH